MKKDYSAPQMKVYPVKRTDIVTGSGSNSETLSNASSGGSPSSSSKGSFTGIWGE